VNFSITKTLFTNLEFMRVMDRSGDEVTNLGLGLNGRL